MARVADADGDRVKARAVGIDRERRNDQPRAGIAVQLQREVGQIGVARRVGGEALQRRVGLNGANRPRAGGFIHGEGGEFFEIRRVDLGQRGGQARLGQRAGGGQQHQCGEKGNDFFHGEDSSLVHSASSAASGFSMTIRPSTSSSLTLLPVSSS